MAMVAALFFSRAELYRVLVCCREGEILVDGYYLFLCSVWLSQVCVIRK